MKKIFLLLVLPVLALTLSSCGGGALGYDRPSGDSTAEHTSAAPGFAASHPSDGMHGEGDIGGR